MVGFSWIGIHPAVTIIGLIAFFIASPSAASSSSRSADGNNSNIIPESTEEAESSRHRHQPSAAALVNGILACQSDPCFHGLCIDHTNSSTYSCFCEDGYTGYQCQTNWNECWNAPCGHGGTCVDGIGRYHCLCRPGFTGDDCQVNIDECQSDPCQNGATCQDGENGFRCRCLPGYEGVFCQVDVSVCRHQQHNDTGHDILPPTCRHGARCVEGPGLDYHCLCPEGWTGKHCETDVDECCSNPCKNGGRCIDLIGSYQCACPHGFTGKNCETALKRCDDGVCGYQGICWLESDEEAVCYCRPDFHGVHCEYQYNECLLPGTKCLNAGRCIDQVDGYSCSCHPLWTGPRCQFPSNRTDRGDEETTSLSTAVNSMTTASPTSLSKYSTAKSTTSGTTSTEHFKTTTMTPLYTATDQYDYEGSTTTLFDGREADSIATTLYFEREQTTTFDSLLTTIVSIPEETTISTAATTAVETTTLLTIDELTTLFPELPTTLSSTSTTSLDETTVSSSSTVAGTETSSTVTSETMTTIVTTPSDLLTTIAIGMPEPRPDDRSGNEEREVRTTTFSHGIRLTTSITAKQSTKLDEISTTTAPSTYPTVDITTVTQPTNRQPIEDNMVTITLEPEIATLSTTTSEIPSNKSGTTVLYPDDLPDFPDSTDPSIMTDPDHTKPRQPEHTTIKSVESTIPVNTCTYDLCMNGGTCVMTSEGWQCRCSWRHEGRRCEKEKKLRIPQFHGNSYLSYVVPDKTLDEEEQKYNQVLEAKIEFSTTTPLGLIAYIHNNDAHVYLAVYVERGALKFRLSCGSQQMTLVETKYNVSDGAIHMILVRFLKVEDRNSSNSFCMGSVKLNNSYSMNGEQRLSDDDQFSWPGRLHIGGRPSGAPTPAELVFLPGLVGCAYSLEIDGKRLDMMKDAVQGKALDECPDRRANCGGLRCLNGGICNNEIKYRCICPMGWVGDQCETRQCPCNPCHANSTCLMSPSDQMICICNYGRVGTLCEIMVNVTRAQFDGTLMGHSSYLSMEPPPFIRDHFELKFNFVTDDARQVALLLFVGQQIDADEKDFLAVSFIRGHVALTWDLGSGTRRIFTARPVAVSTMGGHSVHVGRRGRVAWLQVNNQPTVTGRSPGLMSVLNAHPELFLGGHSSFNHSQLPSDLPLHSGFRGCIYDLVFRSRDQDFNSLWIPTVQSGRGVRQCSIPSCRLRMGTGNVTWQSGNNNVEDRETDHLEDDVC